MYPDVISFDKLNLSQFDWLEIKELEMQLIDFNLVQHGFKTLLKQGKKLELIEAERLTSNIEVKIPVTKFWKHGIRLQTLLSV
ncbi:hypothetical protein TNCV_1382331 [Trichonephila clavipes]|nr:hypothetical protein TNCV_1382331 [Trichonephila clavipes]